MKFLLLGVALLTAVAGAATVRAQLPSTTRETSTLRVRLLGTLGGPVINAQRLGISTLVEAGPEKLLFDGGRGSPAGLSRLGIPVADVRKVFITHLHSDHVVGIPELYLFPWASTGRKLPFEVWGPKGTKSMMEHLEQAFAFDIHIRRDVDEKFSAEGIRAIAHDIREGVVYESNGVKVTAFLVDHGPVAPAFGYRLDFDGRSVVLSGDTRPSENLIKFAQGADVLIHEIGTWKHDPVLNGPQDELIPGTNVTRRQRQIIAAHHTDAEEVGAVFERVKPKLAVLSHYAPNANILPLVRKSYAGPIELGEDELTIDVGATISVERYRPASNGPAIPPATRPELE
ncbi:MAG TPA: MBL fold metallo-hydrolase [Vicinamibacterales bacterium]|jgi:ribonuclease Z